MKANLFFLVFCVSLLNLRGQITFSENFNAPFVPSAHGWTEQNNSVPLGTAGWFQGNGAVFPALNGQVNDFFACNYASQGNSPGGISNFLITPTINLVNGATFRFYTRTDVSAGIFPDRLQVLMSQGSGTGAIGSGTSAVGTFTTLLNDINPNLTTSGYPVVWAGFTGTVSGVTGTVVGRFAFRYFVNNGGITGSNSNYIGIDSVSYALPCPQSVFYVTSTSTAICVGASALLTAVTTLTNAPTSYYWSNGQTASSIVVSPTVTTNYVLNAQNSFGCVGSQGITLVVHPNPTVTAISSESFACLGSSISFSATGADTYAWSGASSATTNTFTYLPAMPGTLSLSVTGTSTAGCIGAASLSLAVNPKPVVTVVSSVSFMCLGDTARLKAGGALNYEWFGPIAGWADSIDYSTSTAGLKKFTVIGTSVAGCTAAIVATLVVSACTAIDKTGEDETRTEVYPNPFTDELNVSGLEGYMKLYTITGQLIMTKYAETLQRIETSQLPKGVYFLEMYTKEGRVFKTQKVLKE